MTRILCVDDHPLMLEGLRVRLANEPDLEYVGGLPDASELVAEVQRTAADIVLLDIALPGPDPFEAAEELARRLPEPKVVFLSAFVRDSYLDAAHRAGAWGYLYKGDDLDEIVDAIGQIIAGKFAFTSTSSARVKPNGAAGRSSAVESRLAAISPTERHVLRLIGLGLSRADIARQMHRSPKTVDTHFAHLMEKLAIHDRVALALFAVREGIAEL